MAGFTTPVDRPAAPAFPWPRGKPKPRPYDPADPTTWTPDQRTQFLGAAGFRHVSGEGDVAIWMAPDGRAVPESAAFSLLLGWSDAKGVFHPPEIPRTSAVPASDTSSQIGFNPATGRNEYFKSVKGVDTFTGIAAPEPVRAAPALRAPFVQKARNESGGVDAVIYDPYTFTEIARVPSDEWADLSPQEKQRNLDAAAERANNAAMARQRQADEAASQRSAASDAAAGARSAAGDVEANRRAGLSASVQGFQSINSLAPQLGSLALDNARFTRDVLRTPPDYLARAFFQQGKTSPLPAVSQADIINNLRNNIGEFNTALRGFSVPPMGAAPPVRTMYTPPTIVPTIAASPSVAPTNPTPSSEPSGSAIGAYVSAMQQAGRGAEAAQTLAQHGFTQAPAMAHGGMTREPVFRVGEDPSGVPNETEEMIVNPTNAPIGVIPNPETNANPGFHRMPDGEMMADEEMAKAQKRAEAIGKVLQHVENPALQHALVDEMEQHRRKSTPTKKMPGYANGTGLFGFTAPQLPSPEMANQNDIQNLEFRYRPPALHTLFGGEAPAAPRFGFNIFTPMQLNALTPDDRDALSTTLATQYNETLPNVESEIARRWSTGNRRRAQAVGF